MVIKNIYVCDNCGAEHVYSQYPVKMGDGKIQYITVDNPDYGKEQYFIGEQHFCSAECIKNFITKKEEETK